MGLTSEEIFIEWGSNLRGWEGACFGTSSVCLFGSTKEEPPASFFVSWSVQCMFSWKTNSTWIQMSLAIAEHWLLSKGQHLEKSCHLSRLAGAAWVYYLSILVRGFAICGSSLMWVAFRGFMRLKTAELLTHRLLTWSLPLVLRLKSYVCFPENMLRIAYVGLYRIVLSATGKRTFLI